jgi:hypothetical protein
MRRRVRRITLNQDARIAERHRVLCLRGKLVHRLGCEVGHWHLSFVGSLTTGTPSVRQVHNLRTVRSLVWTSAHLIVTRISRG